MKPIRQFVSLMSECELEKVRAAALDLLEDPGMRICAEWLKTVIKEAPVRWIPAGDLYWRAV